MIKVDTIKNIRNIKKELIKDNSIKSINHIKQEVTKERNGLFTKRKPRKKQCKKWPWLKSVKSVKGGAIRKGFDSLKRRKQPLKC